MIFVPLKESYSASTPPVPMPFLPAPVFLFGYTILPKNYRVHTPSILLKLKFSLTLKNAYGIKQGSCAL